MNNEKDLKGLGGWLIVVGIGVVLSPIRVLVVYVPIYHEILTDGTWELLTSAESAYYHPLWQPLLAGEMVFNSLLVLAWTYLIYLFFSRHYLFPRVFIGVLVLSVVGIPLDAWLVSFVLPDEPMFDPETTREFTRVLIYSLIWIPYMLVSRRVKATFVERQPGRVVPGTLQVPDHGPR
jgi:hypothetical protein